MYTGDEKLLLNGKELSFSILEFWQWAYSALNLNINRGMLAEFIVKSAMEMGGFKADLPEKNEWGSFDLIGPDIPSLNRPARIEVKTSGYVQVWKNNGPSKTIFNIAPKKEPTDGEYKEETIPKRNNDLYVFCVYTATDISCNILDLSLWEFYVLPTYKLDISIPTQKRISLTGLKKFDIQKLSFATLFAGIRATIEDISLYNQLHK